MEFGGNLAALRDGGDDSWLRHEPSIAAKLLEAVDSRFYWRCYQKILGTILSVSEANGRCSSTLAISMDRLDGYNGITHVD